MNTDFALFSSYDEAVSSTNPWTFCNYDDPGIGFPRDCGPKSPVGSDWNSLTRGGEVDYQFAIDISSGLPLTNNKNKSGP